MAKETRTMVSQGADPASEGCDPSARGTQDEAPQTTTTQQAKEAAMNGNTETTHISHQEEVTMSDTMTQVQQGTPKKRNRMKNVHQKINQLRILAKAGRTREEICKVLKIGIKGFEYLRHKLNDLDKAYYNIPRETSEGRSGKVGKGGIHITKEGLVALGAESIFSEGTPISTWLEGERIVIERADAKTSSANHNGPSALEDFVGDLEEAMRAQANSEEVEVA